MRFRMNLTVDPVNIPAPKFVDLRISIVDALGRGVRLWTPAIIVGRPTDVAYWNVPDHIFGENIQVGYSVSTNSEYSYKTDFEIWRENQEFERQNNARSRPPLDSTPIGTKTPDTKIPPLDSTHIGAKNSYPKTPTTDLSNARKNLEKSPY